MKTIEIGTDFSGVGAFNQAKKTKDKLHLLFLSQKPKGFTKISKCVFTYIRYTSSFMDWDNNDSSCKHIFDSLVSAGVLVDDNPNVIVEFIPKQIKCKRINQRTEIIIEEIE